MRWIPKVAALVLAGAATLAAADVYRSVDADGRVHYSDRWVPGSQLVHIDRHHPNEEESAARAAGDQARLQASNDRIAADEKQAATARAVQQDVQAVREKQCKDSRDRYQKAIQARRVFRTLPNGQKEFLSEKEADQQRVKAREDMDLACGTHTAP